MSWKLFTLMSSKGLLQGMLNRNVTQRISLESVLAHDFFATEGWNKMIVKKQESGDRGYEVCETADIQSHGHEVSGHLNNAVDMVGAE